MKNLWSFIRHNSGIVIGGILTCLVLIWTFGCESQVASITNPSMLVTRAELDLEVDHFLQTAEIRYTDLDRQDEFKRTFFAMAINFMQGGQINPIAVALTIGNLLGIGAVIDNVRKRTYINTLKSERANAKEKENV